MRRSRSAAWRWSRSVTWAQGCLPVVAEGDDLADLAQGQADRLSSPDEPEPPKAASS
jgi:hypothetical protein